MKQYEVVKGSRKVITTTNDGTRFDSRFYVNHGETAGFQNASHKTLAGAQKWAAKVLA